MIQNVYHTKTNQKEAGVMKLSDNTEFKVKITGGTLHDYEKLISLPRCNNH